MFFKTSNLLRYNNMLNYIFDLKGDERIDGVSVTVSFDLNEALENAGEASSSV